VAARKGRILDADFLHRFMDGKDAGGAGGIAAGRPDVGHPHDVLLHHRPDDHAVGMRVGNVVRVDLDRIVLEHHLIGDADDGRGLGLARQRVGDDRGAFATSSKKDLA
jgi:hypothetical protein